MSAAIVLIADLIGSRNVQERGDLQITLSETLERLNRRNPDIASPYTLTLGDEFQVVLNQADHLFHDITSLLATITPELARFSISVGEITTPLNPKQAIGMDGPAFYRARDELETLKKGRGLFTLSGVSSDCLRLANLSLNLVAHNVRKWNPTRIQVLDRLYAHSPVSEIAQALQLSDKAIYKNIDAGELEQVMETFKEAERLINQAVDGR